MQRIALGDRQAFSDLYDATSAKLFGIALRVLRDRGAAEDVLQESYLKIWRHADRYATTGHSPMTWLATIARNTAIDRLRATRARPTDGDALLEDIPSAAATGEDYSIAASEAGRIQNCLKELPQDRQRAVIGAYLDGLSYDDLAKRHEVPRATIGTWLRRGLISLRECLSR